MSDLKHDYRKYWRDKVDLHDISARKYALLTHHQIVSGRCDGQSACTDERHTLLPSTFSRQFKIFFCCCWSLAHSWPDRPYCSGKSLKHVGATLPCISGQSFLLLGHVNCLWVLYCSTASESPDCSLPGNWWTHESLTCLSGNWLKHGISFLGHLGNAAIIATSVPFVSTVE